MAAALSPPGDPGGGGIGGQGPPEDLTIGEVNPMNPDQDSYRSDTSKSHQSIAPNPGNLQQTSYSDKLKMNVKKSERLSRKVLEITLEKEKRESFVKVEDADVAKLAARLGIDIASDMEGYQICPGNSLKILFWMKNSVNLDRFCKDEVFRVSDGVRTGYIRPMDRKEVIVTVKGINFNTPDSLVIDYINKHGRVISGSVVYDTTKEGPFKGLKNGDRKYQVDFSEGRNLGNFHIIDGARVTVFYPGQKKTCGRCYQTGGKCPGNGIAKICAEKNGTKVRLQDHMLEHWREIKFEPSNFRLEPLESAVNDHDVPVKESGKFSPASKKTELSVEEKKRFTGVIVKNIPEAVPDTLILKLLAGEDLDEDNVIDIKTNRINGKASVEVVNLENEKCISIVDRINGTVFHGNKIFCRGLSNLYSPVKTDSDNPNDDKEMVDKVDEASTPEKIQPVALPDPSVLSPPAKNVSITISSQIPGLPPSTPLTKNQAKKLRKKAADAAKKEYDSSSFLKIPKPRKNSLIPGLSEFIFGDDESMMGDDENYDTADDDNSGNVSDVVSKFEGLLPKNKKRVFSPEERIQERNFRSRRETSTT